MKKPVKQNTNVVIKRMGRFVCGFLLVIQPNIDYTFSRRQLWANNVLCWWTIMK